MVDIGSGIEGLGPGEARSQHTGAGLFFPVRT